MTDPIASPELYAHTLTFEDDTPGDQSVPVHVTSRVLFNGDKPPFRLDSWSITSGRGEVTTVNLTVWAEDVKLTLLDRKRTLSTDPVFECRIGGLRFLMPRISAEEYRQLEEQLGQPQISADGEVNLVTVPVFLAEVLFTARS